jgi:hypothetical protein
MKHFLSTSFAALLGLLAVTVQPAPAQSTYPFQPPRFGPGYQTPLSPYLNFLRGGDAAANYFLGVLPEQQRRQDRNIFQGQIQGLTNLLPAPPGVRNRDIDTPLLSTGHPTAFGYTGSYFPGRTALPQTPSNPFRQQQQTGRWPNNSQTPGTPPTKRQ